MEGDALQGDALELLRMIEEWQCFCCLRFVNENGGLLIPMKFLEKPVRTHYACWDNAVGQMDGTLQEQLQRTFLRALQLQCYICQARGGARMICRMENCSASFHWTCRNDEAEIEGQVPWCQRCFEQTSTVRCV